MSSNEYEKMAKAGWWLIAGAALLLTLAVVLTYLSYPGAVYVTGPFWGIPLVIIYVGVMYVKDPLVLGVIALIPSIVALAVFFLVFDSILQLLGGILGLLGSILAIVGGVLKGR